MSSNKSFSTETSERYSRALFEVAQEASELEKIENDFKNFASLLINNLEIKNFESVTNNFENKRLDNLLVEMKLVSSRQKAISLIMRGNVFVEEEKVDKPGKVVKINQKISMKLTKFRSNCGRSYHEGLLEGTKLPYLLKYNKTITKLVTLFMAVYLRMRFLRVLRPLY